MKKKTIYLFCTACLAWSCSNDPTGEPDRTPGSPPGEPVPVKLELQAPDYAAPPTRVSRSVRATASGNRSGVVDVEISAIEPAPGTRAGGGEVYEIPDDQKVFRLDILQFDGTGGKAQLIRKITYTQQDGDLAKYDFTQMQFLASGQEKHRVIVLGNADPALYDKLTVKDQAPGTAGTEYSSLLLENISRTGNTDTSFPRVSHNQTLVPVFSGMTVTTIATGSQIGVELIRNVAKVNFDFRLSPAMLEAYSHWDILLNTIPPASFYTPQAYEPPFPELQLSDPYYSKVLGMNVASSLADAEGSLLKASLYLPVNLQNSVPGTVVSTRYLNAPTFATSLQLLGKTISPTSGEITQTVVFMIPLGANFTDDYSIRPNNAINYRITLASDSPDDSSVVKFIAGKFAGNFRQFTNPADNSECWGFDQELEVWPTDVEYKHYPNDGNDPNYGTLMPWASVMNVPASISATGVTDGMANTQSLCGSSLTWHQITAAYMCYRQLNALEYPLTAARDNMWFLPAVNQLVGIYVAGGSQINAMQSHYWSSTYLGGNPNQQKVYWIGNNGTVEIVPVSQPNQTLKAAVRGCRIPPPR